MTGRSELLREEAERVRRTAGYYITPERLAALMGTAQKVMAALSAGGAPMSYTDCGIVLDIVRSSMARVRGEAWKE